MFGPWRRASFEEGGELGKAAEPEKKGKKQESVLSWKSRKKWERLLRNYQMPQ